MAAWIDTLATRRSETEKAVEQARGQLEIAMNSLHELGERRVVLEGEPVLSDARSEMRGSRIVWEIGRERVEKLRGAIDKLTGIANRRHLEERMHEMWEHATRLNEPIACVMCDIDKFKSVNDEHGHQAGDAVLRQMAEILREEAREIDRVGRYGGEEFLLLLPGTVLDSAVTFAERLRQRVDDRVDEVAPILRAQRHHDRRLSGRRGDAAEVDVLHPQAAHRVRHPPALNDWCDLGGLRSKP